MTTEPPINEITDIMIFGLVVLLVLGAALAVAMRKLRAFRISQRRWKERALRRREM